MEWEDTDGDGHKELNGDVGPVAKGASIYYGAATIGLGTAAGTAGASVVGAPAAIPLAVTAGATGLASLATDGLAYYADRHKWKYKIEPGQVIEDTGEAIESTKDKAGNVVDWAKDKAGDLFDGDGPLLLPPRVPLFPGPISLPGPISMRRLDEAFARLQAML
jgi:hypothetical protein